MIITSLFDTPSPKIKPHSTLFALPLPTNPMPDLTLKRSPNF